MALGYPEPDPRDDLAGKDVARKGLILARLLGYSGGALVAEDLTPRALRRLALPAFLKRLPEADADWRRRSDAARAVGCVLRYAVTASARGARAGLVWAPLDSALGALSGTRNLISFTTARYAKEPLVVSGPGAGAEVTASGILNDIQYLAATR
jgi:homoserine dehydrogenase